MATGTQAEGAGWERLAAVEQRMGALEVRMQGWAEQAQGYVTGMASELDKLKKVTADAVLEIKGEEKKVKDAVDLVANETTVKVRELEKELERVKQVTGDAMKEMQVEEARVKEVIDKVVKEATVRIGEMTGGIGSVAEEVKKTDARMQ